jgi:hypothetical protein
MAGMKKRVVLFEEYQVREGTSNPIDFLLKEQDLETLAVTVFNLSTTYYARISILSGTGLYQSISAKAGQTQTGLFRITDAAAGKVNFAAGPEFFKKSEMPYSWWIEVSLLANFYAVLGDWPDGNRGQFVVI